ncbi:MAG: hypothetical protein KAJ06_06775 [Gammaproteobacteria bacterium]|nr:hypothetical protein [Gammaproteobacteria bacterium]
MPQPTLLKCSQTTATFSFILLGSILIFAGCAQLYRTIGMNEDQVSEQVAADQKVRGEIIDTVRVTTTEMITTALAGLGTIVSGFLARWLGTERKITKTLITGIESNDSKSTKEAVHSMAVAAGVEKKLHKRVAKLT